ncbi:MAG: hypothetical protein ACON38_18120 [Akkermansiaceae bacterium]
MMKALREKEREKEAQGEIVTRSDGSVARKVKVRKRRSDQPEKASPEKAKKSLIFKILLAASLCLILVLTAVFVLVSFNSKSYREETEKKAGEWVGAEVNLNGLKLLPSSVKMTDASFVWPENSYVRSLKLKRIQGHASLLSFLGSRMGGVEVGGAIGELVVAMPVGEGQVVQDLEEEEFPFGFDRYYCDALDVTFGENGGLLLKGASVSLRHMGAQGFRVGIDEGGLQLRGWEMFPIANAIIKVEGDELLIEPLTLEMPIDDLQTLSASLRIEGGISLTEGETSELDFEASNFPAPLLFGNQLGRLFEGEIRTTEEGKLIYQTGEDFPEEFSLKFRGHQFELKDLPFLAALKEMFPNEGYDQIYFDTDISGVLRARSGGVALESFKMAQKDIFRLSGSMIVSNEGQLAGRLTLLINRGLINSEPRLKSYPGLNKIEKAYSRVDFELSGTVDEPDDNFRIVTGLESRLPGTGKIIKEDNEDLWDTITKPKLEGSE